MISATAPRAAAAPRGRLTDADREAIAHYTENGGFKAMNSHLRSGKPAPAAVQRAIVALKVALDKLPSHQRVVHRFMSLGLRKQTFDTRAISRFLEGLKVGRVVVEKGFMSTTANTIPSGKFDDGTTVRIEVRARSAKNIASASMYAAEAEYLIPPGARLRVVSVKGELADSYADGGFTNPEPSAWVGYYDAFKRYFPPMTDAQVLAKAAKGLTPRLVVTLEELPPKTV